MLGRTGHIESVILGEQLRTEAAKQTSQGQAGSVCIDEADLG